MSNRLINLVEKEYYHIYNRENSKQVIFQDSQDVKYFQELLYIMNKKSRSKKGNIFNVYTNEKEMKDDEDSPLVAIGAYTTMSNHFHILMRQEQKDGISLFMQKVATGYVMYYNKKYIRTGGLFEGRFKARHAGDDSYLKYLFAYIHLNPLKIIDPNWKMLKYPPEKYIVFLNTYAGSSYLEYFGTKREEEVILNREAFPDYFSKKEVFMRDILSWIKISHPA